MNEIVPGLFLGNIHDATNLSLLKTNDISHIINVSDYPNAFSDANEFTYTIIDIEDHESSDINRYFTKISRLIHNLLLKKQKILIHCNAGVSRSPTFVIAYLVQKRKMTLDEAYKYVKSRRSIINPNAGFFKQLNNRFGVTST